MINQILLYTSLEYAKSRIYSIMIILPVINFVLPLMLTCLVLVDDPPRCSECRKKIEIGIIQNKKSLSASISNSDEFSVILLNEKHSKN